VLENEEAELESGETNIQGELRVYARRKKHNEIIVLA
jgi:hypothetical protein